jgi:hypothetical protein
MGTLNASISLGFLSLTLFGGSKGKGQDFHEPQAGILAPADPSRVYHGKAREAVLRDSPSSLSLESLGSGSGTPAQCVRDAWVKGQHRETPALSPLRPPAQKSQVPVTTKYVCGMAQGEEVDNTSSTMRAPGQQAEWTRTLVHYTGYWGQQAEWTRTPAPPQRTFRSNE